VCPLLELDAIAAPSVARNAKSHYACSPPTAALVGLLFVSPLSPKETGNNNSRRKHDDNDRWNTHHDASPNNAKMHYEILRKPTYPLIRGL
jgi:hypothetical protein